MVREIITYPTPPSVEYGTDVRIFDERLYSLITDLKDTIEANDLEALAAFQIGSYFNVVVVKKEDGTFLELVNPRMFNPSGKITTVEKTAYFPGLSAAIERHANISVVYQDREGNDLSLKASGAFAVLLQRKLDYTFGANFLSKLSKEERKIFEQKLEHGIDIAISESCPTKFKRDYFKKGANIFMIAMLGIVIASFFSDMPELWSYEVYAFVLVLVCNLIYVVYGYYEGRKYTTCTSCQVGNLIGTAFLSLIKAIPLFVIAYFIIEG